MPLEGFLARRDVETHNALNAKIGQEAQPHPLVDCADADAEVVRESRLVCEFSAWFVIFHEFSFCAPGCQLCTRAFII